MALLVGGGCGLVAVLGVIGLVIAVAIAGGSSASADTGDETSSPSAPTQSPSDPVGDAMEGAVYKRVPSTNVEVPVAQGWKEAKQGLYTFAISGDDDALLAFTTVSSLGEFAGRTQHAVRVFRITDCTMDETKRVTIGPDQLRGRLKEGSCTFNGVPAQVATVLVESGRNALPFIIYAVDKRAAPRTVTQAQQSIARMRLH